MCPTRPSLVVNGGFETGDLTGWYHLGNTNDTSVTSGTSYVHSGQYGVDTGPVNTPGYLSQIHRADADRGIILRFQLAGK